MVLSSFLRGLKNDHFWSEKGGGGLFCSKGGQSTSRGMRLQIFTDLQPVFDVIGEVMARGPKKTPTAILKMRGAWRAKTRTGEPQPNSTQLDSPEFLGPREKIIFDQMSEALYRVGVLTEIDGSSLSRYAICLVRWIDAEAALSAGTPTHIEIMGDDEKIKGYKETPPYMVSCKMHDQLLKLECQFGLTPASRPNLQSSNGGKDGIIDIMRAIQ